MTETESKVKLTKAQRGLLAWIGSQQAGMIDHMSDAGIDDALFRHCTPTTQED